jgi:quercetin dioxygenase-like cupin family protein
MSHGTPYRTRVDETELVQGLKEEDGWYDMRVRFLVNKERGGTDSCVLGWTILPPGAKHDKHRHFHADEFLYVLSGKGYIYTDDGEEPSREGDVIYTPRGHWHGFNNTGDVDAVLAWGWVGAGSLEDAGYEVPGAGE